MQVKQLFNFLIFKYSTSNTPAKDPKFKLTCGTTEAADKQGLWNVLPEKCVREMKYNSQNIQVSCELW